MKKTFILMTALSLALSPLAGTVVLAQEAGEGLEAAAELVYELESDEEEDVEFDDFSGEELVEAEPSELPGDTEDPSLTRRMFGRMLLDVEGNGEVYYVDPVTGGKEYLADGISAHRLLERRALGISEENFARLTVGTEKDEASVCEDSDLGNKLKGRMVLRVEESGEAYWIYPENCRAYYAGTHDSAYELMKSFSLGIKKRLLAKIADNKRQRAKRRARFIVYAYAEDNELSLAEARDALKEEFQNAKTCLADSGISIKNGNSKQEVIDSARECAREAGLPEVSNERKAELKEAMKEARQESLKENYPGLSAIRVKNILSRIRNRNNASGSQENIADDEPGNSAAQEDGADEADNSAS